MVIPHQVNGIAWYQARSALPSLSRRRTSANTFFMFASRKLIASAKYRAVPISLLNDLTNKADGTLAQGRTFGCLETDLVARDLTKLPDIS
jgi:hypothetical protein